MSTIGKDMARGCGRSVVIRLAAVLVVVPLFCVFVIFPLWLINSSNMNPLWMIVPLGLFMTLLFGGGAAYMGFVLYRRKQTLDAAFCPLGLEGKAYLSFFRQYHGLVRDRQVDVYLARGPHLEIEIGTSLQTRLGVTGAHGDTRFAAGLMNRQALHFDDPALQNLTVFPHDEAWTRELFDNHHAAEIFRRLTALESTFTRQQVILRPGVFQLLLTGNTQMLGFTLDPELVRQWVNDLLRLAHIAEHISPPQVTAEISSVERAAYRVRNANPYLALWIGLGTLVFFGFVTVIVAILVAVLTGLN